ncbi:hypothetical protein MC885_001539, partial [Smutsia gigantea]
RAFVEKVPPPPNIKAYALQTFLPQLLPSEKDSRPDGKSSVVAKKPSDLGDCPISNALEQQVHSIKTQLRKMILSYAFCLWADLTDSNFISSRLNT